LRAGPAAAFCDAAMGEDRMAWQDASVVGVISRSHWAVW
jgi:hypothetical protein